MVSRELYAGVHFVDSGVKVSPVASPRSAIEPGVFAQIPPEALITVALS